jgi:beta-lactamase regulating signal transducer with metallopeptidase domain
MSGPLLNHIWQSTIFALLAALLTLAFRNNRASVRYWLWLAASLKFLVPFAPLIGLGARVHRVAAASVAVAAQALVTPFPASIAPTHSWLPVVWLCGFLALAFWRLRAWLRFRAAVSAGRAMGPAVFGLWRPILLLPPGIAERLTPTQLAAIVAHEQCHVRRRDNFLAASHMVVESLFWFHPLVWWIGARLVEERERACDEEVLQQGHAPRAYADAILNVCRLYLESPLTCMSDVTGGDIGRRVEAIMTNREKRGLHIGKKLALAIAGVCALAVPLAIGMTNQAAAPSIHVSSSWATLQIPLDTLSGEVDIMARVVPVVHGDPGAVAAALRDKTQASKGTYSVKIYLEPGSYECRLLVIENASGRIATHKIPFEVK